MTTQNACKDRIGRAWAGRVADLRNIMDGKTAEGDPDPDGYAFNEYGLCFDYVAPGTFDRQPRGYWRYQLSWGGPSDEIRFYSQDRIEYWFMDWYDGARKTVTRNAVAQWLWDEFEGLGMLDSERERAREEAQ